jgi:hypothetical protein
MVENDDNFILETRNPLNGRLKSILRVVDYIKIRDSKASYIPIWLLVVLSYLLVVFLIILATSIYVKSSQRQGLLSENCSYRSCKSGLNMKCINRTCSCLTSQYYLKGCLNRKTYSENCLSTISNCLINTGLLCLDGLCKCASSYYWNGSICIAKSTYSGTCTNTNQCLTDLKLTCNSTQMKCLCSSDRCFLI